MRRTSTLLDLLPLLLGLALGVLLLGGCGGDAEADAFGNFRADEVTVSAEAQGRLVRFRAGEGERLDEGEVVGLIDTTRLAIERRALLAGRESLLAQRAATLAPPPEIAALAGALRERLETAEEELARTQRLHAAEAATSREFNERRGEVAVLREQIQQALARVGAVREQAAGIDAQVRRTDSQIDEIDQRLADARVVNPRPGTVLVRIAEAGERVQPGSPLYTIADLDTLVLRAYATGDQLSRLRLGMAVDVVVDAAGGGLETRPGTVAWIAAEAQFTPTPIQTRDERAELVYAFDVRVPNPDGLLKVGMPGEVLFRDRPSRAGEAS